MSAEARGRECAQDELVSRKTEVIWDLLCVAEKDVLFDGARITFEGRVGQATL
jgi:hypothetical protein